MMAKNSSEWSKLLGFTEEEFPVCIQELMSYCGYKALTDLLNIDEAKLRTVESFLSKIKKLKSEKYLNDYDIQTQDNSFIFYPAHREKILSIPSKYPWMQIRKPENLSTVQKKKRNSTDLMTKLSQRDRNAKEKLIEQVKKLIKSNNGLKLQDDSVKNSNIIEFNSSKDNYLYVCRFKCPICEEVSSTKFETNWKTGKINDHFKSHDKYVNAKPETISPNKSKLQGSNRLLKAKLVQKLANSIKSVGLTLHDKEIIERNITDLRLCKHDFSYECLFECPFCVESSKLTTGSKWNVSEISKHLKTHADNRKESMPETCLKEPKVVSSTSEQKAGTSSEFYASNSFYNQVLPEPQYKDSFHTKLQLTVFAHNVNGLRTKLSDVFVKARNNDYDIYIFTETGLDSRIPNDAIFPSETFRVYRCDRSSETSLKKSGGGVLIAVNTRYDSRVIKRGDSHGCEQIYVEVKEGIRTLILGAIYIPPDSKIYELHMGIVTQIYDGFDENTTFILYGDFNLPHLTWTQTTPNTYFPTKITKNAGRITMEICTRMGLHQINCCLNDHNRILDLVWTNRPENCVCYVSSSNFLKNESHHKAMRIEIGWNPNAVDEMNTVQKKEERVECKPDINLLTDIELCQYLSDSY